MGHAFENRKHAMMKRGARDSRISRAVVDKSPSQSKLPEAILIAIQLCAALFRTPARLTCPRTKFRMPSTG